MYDRRPARLVLPFALLLAAPSLGQDTSDDLLEDDPDRLAALEGVRSDSSGAAWDHARVDAIAPAGVHFARRLQGAGTWLLGYTYERTRFDGLQRGRTSVGAGDIGGTIVALDQTKVTHTIEGWYAVEDDWSAFVRVPIHDNERDSTFGGTRATESADGIGDVQVGAAWDVWEDDGEFLRLHLALGLPTGSTDEAGFGGRAAPYPLQLGNGSYDLFPGITWVKQRESGSAFGAQLVGRFSLERNDDGYGAGDTFEPSFWYSHALGDSGASASLRVRGHYASDYTGQRNGLNPADDPTNDANHQGSDRHDILGGAQWLLGEPDQPQHLLAFEAGVPFDEWSSGTNLKVDWFLALAYRLSL